MSEDRLGLYRRLFTFALPYRRRLVLSVIASLGVSLADVTTAKLVEPLIDKVLTPEGYHILAWVPLMIIGLAVLKGGSRYAQEFLIKTAGQLVVQDIRNRLFGHSLKLSLGFFARHSAGNLMSRTLNDISMMQRSVSTVLVEMLREGATLIGLICLAFYNDWRLAGMALLVLPLAGFPAARIGRRIKRYAKQGQGALAELTVALEQAFSGIKIIKAFGAEKREEESFQKENQNYYQFIRKTIKYDVGTTPIIEIFASFGIAAVLWYGVQRVIGGDLTQGELFSTLAAIAMLYTPAKRLSRVNNSIQQSMAAAERVFEILDEPIEIADTEQAKTIPRLSGQVEFDQVSFAYDELPVLTDFSLNMVPGEVIALVGPSGAGKTTVAGLLARFYDPQGGQISLDGQPLPSLSLASLRKNLAYVDQETFLFNDSVRNNVRYGCPEASDEQIRTALRMAYAEEFVAELPEGLDSMIGDRGVRLSGGQRQRLCIARALLKDAPLLILDEATSALDTESEAMVQKALENLMVNRTTLVIAHRLSTIMHADKILVLEQGRIVEQGKHEDLLESGGLYRRLYEMQFQSGVEA